MPQANVIIMPKIRTCAKLPGTVELPDVKSKTQMGSGAITSVISSGGSAIVYEIWNPDLEVVRAVKLLHPDHSRESEERFQTEMKITAKLHHPNIIEIYAVGKWNNLPYIEMERIDGVTLEEVITKRGALPIEVCTSIAIMVGRALNYSHNQDYVLYGQKYNGIIHRDLKPSNIMVDRNGMVKLMDFGIAKPVKASMHTCDGSVMGTMQYLAPEQLNGEELDVRADIYSLGTVIYEMITGQRTFPEENLAKLVTDKLSNDFIPIENFSVKIPPKLRVLVQKCLNNEKEKRLDNALALLKLLSDVHKSVTDLSPEQVMDRFMKSEPDSRATTRIRKRRHVLPPVLWTATSLAGAFTTVVMLSLTGVVRLNIPVPLTMPAAEPAVHEATTELLVQAPSVVNVAVEYVKPATPQRTPEKQVSRLPVVKTASRTGAAERKKTTIDRTVDHNEIERLLSAVPSKQEPTRHQTPEQTTRVSNPEPASAPAPVETAVTAVEKIPLVDRLKQEYFTDDLMTILNGEIEQKNFTNAREVFRYLDASKTRSIKGQVYKLRILAGIGDKAAMQRFLETADVADAEFYIGKANALVDNGNYVEALAVLDKALKCPAVLLESTVARQKSTFLTARCRSVLYDRNPTDENRKTAMESWYNLKSLLRAHPEHPYYRKADTEIRRIDRGISTARGEVW
jgi:serine/threonine protein kinase